MIEINNHFEVTARAKTLENFTKLGFIYDVQGGIQVDINAATKKLSDGIYVDAPLCDHNCRVITQGVKTGNYECPAARTLHPKLSAKTFAGKDKILTGIVTARQGLWEYNHEFASSEVLKDYFTEFRIPDYLQKPIREMLLNGGIEVNLFGGNPELHPEITEIIAALKTEGFKVNLTTTGGRFMRDRKFTEEIVANPPRVIALSADDFESPEEIRNLSGYSPEDLISERNKIDFLNGQRRKAYEAVFSARLADILGENSRVLFNLVVHPGNLRDIEETISALRESFPKAYVNPYFAQSSFVLQESVFEQSQVARLWRFIENRITDHLTFTDRLVPRLHYWLMLRAAMAVYPDSADRVAKLSGYGIWKCYEAKGAARYLQIGASPREHCGDKIAGGHLSCYWKSDAVASEKQVWNIDASEVKGYLDEDIQSIARSVPSKCPGCIMPRLVFDMITTEVGMDKELKDNYLQFRKNFAGF